MEGGRIWASFLLQHALVTLCAFQHDVTTQYYPNPNLKNDANCGLRNPNHNVERSIGRRKVAKERFSWVMH